MNQAHSFSTCSFFGVVAAVCLCVPQILALSKRPDIARCVVNSIGPSIYGHDDVKMALALAMFSGEAKQFENGHRIRGDINVLVLGDPGTLRHRSRHPYVCAV